jgi:hypothetical protein
MAKETWNEVKHGKRLASKSGILLKFLESVKGKANE